MSLIYHYTNTAGFMGIIQSQSLWATNSNFLNDHQEMKKGIEIFRQHLLNEKTFKDVEHLHKENMDLLLSLIYSLVKASEDNIYLTSFTEDRDYLRQWMSYCQFNDGVCIGFNKDKLQSNFSDSYKNETEYCFSKINYSDIHDFQNFINLKTMLSIFETEVIIQNGKKSEHTSFQDLDNESQNNIFSSYMFALIHKAILKISSFKPKEFQDEKEFRLSILNNNDKVVKHRIRNGYIIPYLVIPFQIEALEEIILSPSSDFELRKKGFESFSKAQNVNCKITKSNCSLRDF